jgi:hypothetical protein
MESLTEFRSSGVGTDKFPELLFFGFHIENSGETESGPKGGDDRGLTSPLWELVNLVILVRPGFG